MAVSKRWHIALSTTKSARPVHVSIPQSFGIVLLTMFIAIFVLFLGSLFYITKNQHKISTAKNLILENKQLRHKLAYLSTQVDSITLKIQLMEKWENKIRSDKNFDIINEEIRQMGSGGIPVIDTTFHALDENLSTNYNFTLNKIIQLNSRTDFDLETHQKLLTQADLKKLLYLNTPSIYPTYGRISDGFGWRTHPITKKRSFHNGLDFGNKAGTPIYATADGVVKQTGRQKLFGKYVALDHQFGYQTNYAHLHKVLVKKGDEVKRGQIIAEMGNTGRSTGAHLHYEVLRYNKYRNPYKYLNKLEDDIVLSK